MNILFFNNNRDNFLPLLYTKPLAKVRFGILTIEEKWQSYFDLLNFDCSFSYNTEDYLQSKFPLKIEEENIFINTCFLPNEKLAGFIVNNLNAGEALFYNSDLVVAKCSLEQYQQGSYYIKDTNESFVSVHLEKITDLFTKNEEVIKDDFRLVTQGRVSQKLSETNTVIGEDIFIEEGAKIEASVLNSTDGPIYIGKNAEVMEGSLVRGGLALCEGGVLKMGSKIYGPTTIGRFSKVGGEVNNSVIQDFSNKGHDGFLGNSIIGEWCNLGADSNTSNLKNNYGEVKLWDYKSEEFQNSGLQFCGLIMGDHSKCGINTMFNTGTTVGVGANIFDSGFPPKYIPSYYWGGSKGFEEHKLNKMFEVADKVMQRRDVSFSELDKEMLTAIFEQTAEYRK